MTDQLLRKLAHSIELLRRSEKLALRYDPDDGFFLAFSGGKDSQALYHVAQLSGVRFKAHFSPTTVDPPALIRFIRRQYPEVQFERVEKSIFDRAIERGILPTQRIRWCCADFKERAGAGKVTLIGIRHSESARRSKRNEVEVSGKKFSGELEEFYGWSEERIRKKMPKNLNVDEFSEAKETEVRCIGGKDKILISPIIDWTEDDVWEFLNEVLRVPHCELYDKGWKRIGCIMCPMSGVAQKKRELETYPHVYHRWIETIKAIRNGGGYARPNEGRTLRLHQAPQPTALDARQQCRSMATDSTRTATTNGGGITDNLRCGKTGSNNPICTLWRTLDGFSLSPSLQDKANCLRGGNLRTRNWNSRLQRTSSTGGSAAVRTRNGLRNASDRAAA